MQQERLALIHVTPEEMQIIQAYRQSSPNAQTMLVDMAWAAAEARPKAENVTYLIPSQMC